MIYRNTINEVENCISKIINVLEGNTSDSVEQELNKLLSSLREDKKKLREDTQLFIRNQTSRMARNLPDMIWSDRDNAEKIANDAVWKMN